MDYDLREMKNQRTKYACVAVLAGTILAARISPQQKVNKVEQGEARLILRQVEATIEKSLAAARNARSLVDILGDTISSLVECQSERHRLAFEGPRESSVRMTKVIADCESVPDN
jgi:hypothetical protein